MLRCPELSRLPKAPRLRSINFRKQTPGSPATLISPISPSSDAILDPNHPAASISKNAYPEFRSNVFGIKAYPMALLDRPEFLWQPPFKRTIDTWEQRISRAQEEKLFDFDRDLPKIFPMILNNKRANRIPMSFLIATSKKRTSGKKSIRVSITRKLKTLLNLVVIRGAHVMEANGKAAIVFDELDRPDQWILRGWSYIFYPTLEIYRMPYHKLVPQIRQALRFIWEKGSTMEQRWETQISTKSHVAGERTRADTSKRIISRSSFRLRPSEEGSIVHWRDRENFDTSKRVIRPSFGLRSSREDSTIHWRDHENVDTSKRAIRPSFGLRPSREDSTTHWRDHGKADAPRRAISRPSFGLRPSIEDSAVTEVYPTWRQANAPSKLTGSSNIYDRKTHSNDVTKFSKKEDVEKASVAFFKGLSQKDSSYSINWNLPFMEDEDEPDIDLTDADQAELVIPRQEISSRLSSPTITRQPPTDSSSSSVLLVRKTDGTVINGELHGSKTIEVLDSKDSDRPSTSPPLHRKVQEDKAEKGSVTAEEAAKRRLFHKPAIFRVSSNKK